MFIPKARNGGVANAGGLDTPTAISDYQLVEVSGVDDDYAYENLTMFVIIDDEGSSGSGDIRLVIIRQVKIIEI
jgi:hypothetical protein